MNRNILARKLLTNFVTNFIFSGSVVSDMVLSFGSKVARVQNKYIDYVHNMYIYDC